MVSLDLPAHGADQRPGETRPLVAWRTRLDAGENVVRDFTVRLSRLIDTLATDRIALVGTSRGGFMALHGMAADPRVDAVVAFMPVTSCARSVNSRCLAAIRRDERRSTAAARSRHLDSCRPR